MMKLRGRARRSVESMTTLLRVGSDAVGEVRRWRDK